ncbi:MAG TPA: NfeD family protein [Anaerolineales bacterium]|nr:NfeD family protein [Anaerolineales bacterium]
MNILVNPDIAYLLLMFGSIFLLMAIVTPGTHLLEGGALFLLAAAGYEIYNLGFNWWALIILVLALVPFVYSIRKTGREWALAVSTLALIVGSIYLFPGTGFLPAVNPIMAVIVSLLSTGFIWFVVRKGIQAFRARPLQDLQNLVGKTGQAKTEILDGGSVQVASELWSARSDQPIPAGSRVRVVSREGFTLIVESDGQSKK